MRIAFLALIAVLAAALMVLIIGLLLPRSHIAAAEALFGASADDIYTVISDVEGGVRWRSGLERVEVLSDQSNELRWRETADWGTMTFVREVNEPPGRLISRIVDEGQGFGGTWTYEVEPAGNATVVRITEHGDVSNPVFRFMSRFVFGHHSSIETYLRDLGRELGEEVNPVRVDVAGSTSRKPMASPARRVEPDSPRGAN